MSDHGGTSHTDRMLRHRDVGYELAGFDDTRLRSLLEATPPIGSGIGGESTLVYVGGTPVFAKRIPLTDIERKPENLRSTANLFALPARCHYGVGSPGFGVWREFVAHSVTTQWVLTRRAACFPLLFHWRVLDGLRPAPTPDEHLDVDAAVHFWKAPGVRDRLAALAEATASVVLFLEYVPTNVQQWLDAQAEIGVEAVDAAIAAVERALIKQVPAMNSAGLFHFDAHFANILTDGSRLYFTDFGLAASPRFDLTEDETAFLRLNRTHDVCHTITRLVDWVVGRLVPSVDGVRERDELIRQFAAGRPTDTLPPGASALVRRYAPIASIVNDFYHALHGGDPTVPYPADEIEAART